MIVIADIMNEAGEKIAEYHGYEAGLLLNIPPGGSYVITSTGNHSPSIPG